MENSHFGSHIQILNLFLDFVKGLTSNAQVNPDKWNQHWQPQFDWKNLSFNIYKPQMYGWLSSN